MVGLYPVESAVDVLGDLTSGLKFKNISFEARRFVETLEKPSIGKFDLVTGAVALLICECRWCCKREDMRHAEILVVIDSRFAKADTYYTVDEALQKVSWEIDLYCSLHRIQ